jgi:polar amino acid transport system substrate-binding protein
MDRLVEFRRLRRLALALLLTPALLAAQTRTTPAGTFVMGTVDAENTYAHRWYRRIYSEAFRRLGIRLELAVYPNQRIGIVLDQGAIDGEAARASIYSEVHPELIRVEESVLDVVFALYATHPTLELNRLDDLRRLKLRTAYRRGVLVCEKALASLLPPEQIIDVTGAEQGLQMMLSGRADLMCAVDQSLTNVLIAPEFAGVTSVRKVLELQAAPLFPYLHRRHAELAPKLAAVLKAMKAEGLIERYRLEAAGGAAR